MLSPVRLRCEYRANPVGIAEVQPRLSWVLESEERSQVQSAYQVLVADSEQALAARSANVWDSGRVESNQSTHVLYTGRALETDSRYWWKVRVWDQEGRASEYSSAAWWQMGLLHRTDWVAKWISFDTDAENEMGMKPAPYLRRTFFIDKPVVKATLYAAAKGLYRLRLNGQPVGEDALAPDWTDYGQRIVYNSYDVGELVRRGDNALGAILGDGWYCGYVGFQGRRNSYGEQPAFLAQLHLELEDGSTAVVVTDDEWIGSSGPILYSDLLMGEAYDARREMQGWDESGFDDALWRPVMTQSNSERLIAQTAESVQVVERIPVRSVSEPARNLYVFDLGQNFAGWVRLGVRGAAGTRLQLRYGELLNPDGTVYTGNLRKARATDTYILRGEGEEVWEPHFTYHGFRYVQIESFPTGVVPKVQAGCVVHSAVGQVGHFKCSSLPVNQLWQNIMWGQRSNFVSVPTDCPQRDERLGWLGDVLAFGQTACLNMDVAAFFIRWMISVEDAQSSAGAFPDVAPRLAAVTDGAPGWGDAGVYLPWLIYQFYGDTRIIERHYAAMTRWMEYIREANPDCLRTERLNRNYGDWLSFHADTPSDVIATALWAQDAALMAHMAQVIGRNEDSRLYAELHTDIKAAFIDAYVAADGRIKGETQTCYALALHIGLLPPHLREAAARHLVVDIERRGWHLSTGFLGTPFLLPALSEAGYTDIAYRLLFSDTVPSWGHMIKQGATTIWERWDSLQADGNLFDPTQPTFLHAELGPIAGMNSFNHYGLGSVGEWLYRYVAGIRIDPQRPGYSHIIIEPHPGGELTFACAQYDSIRGPIRSKWCVEDGQFHLTVSIPANTTATLYLPSAVPSDVQESGQPIDQIEGVEVMGVEAGRTILAVGSGTYSFVWMRYESPAAP